MRRFPVTESSVSDDPADLFISYANAILPLVYRPAKTRNIVDFFLTLNV